MPLMVRPIVPRCGRYADADVSSPECPALVSGSACHEVRRSHGHTHSVTS